MAKRLDGRVAVITGAASEGARVLVADMRPDEGAAVAAELGEAGAFQRVDVSREPDVRAMIEAAVGRWGRLDCLFNNAGFGGALGPIESTPVEEFDLTFDVLLKGVFLGMKHAAPVMKAQRSGSIISTASAAAFINGGSPHLYGVAKLGVVKLTETVALELGAHGVRVNCICPGYIATPLAAGHPVTTDDDMERLRERTAPSQPLGRMGEPIEIARAALFLASDESSFVTGHALAVDGGVSAGPPWAEWPEFMTRENPIRMYRPSGR